jgi:hypothetical protein
LIQWFTVNCLKDLTARKMRDLDAELDRRHVQRSPLELVRLSCVPETKKSPCGVGSRREVDLLMVDLVGKCHPHGQHPIVCCRHRPRRWSHGGVRPGHRCVACRHGGAALEVWVHWVGGWNARGVGRVRVTVMEGDRQPFTGRTTTGRRGSRADAMFGGAGRSAWKWIRRRYWIRVGAGDGDPIVVGGEAGNSGWVGVVLSTGSSTGEERM